MEVECIDAQQLDLELTSAWQYQLTVAFWISQLSFLDQMYISQQNMVLNEIELIDQSLDEFEFNMEIGLLIDGGDCDEPHTYG